MGTGSGTGCGSRSDSPHAHAERAKALAPLLLKGPDGTYSLARICANSCTLCRLRPEKRFRFTSTLVTGLLLPPWSTVRVVLASE